MKCMIKAVNIYYKKVVVNKKKKKNCSYYNFNNISLMSE